MLKLSSVCLIFVMIFLSQTIASPFIFDFFSEDDEDSKSSENVIEKNKNNFVDWIFSILDYFSYDDNDEKYLICKNCTITISQKGTQFKNESGASITTSSIKESEMPSMKEEPPKIKDGKKSAKPISVTELPTASDHSTIGEPTTTLEPSTTLEPTTYEPTEPLKMEGK